jgi:hypothetical protein
MDRDPRAVEIAAPLIAKVRRNEIDASPDVVVGRSEYGSILLNQKAWMLLHPALKAIPGLQTRHGCHRVDGFRRRPERREPQRLG